MEQLLNTEQINDIVAFANACPELRHPDAINIGLEVTSVLKMGFKTGVIIFHGNEDTGFEHIKKRHDFFSGKTYWDQSGKLSYPSKFSPRSIPILEYTETADAMYSEVFLNVAGNKSPHFFDLYEGIPDVAEAEGRKYKMILYKNTKIVHTLYPTNAKYSAKKPAGFHFHKGRVFADSEDKKEIVTVTIPYYDQHQILRYTAVVTYDFAQKLEYLKLVIHRDRKQDLKTEMNPIAYTGEKLQPGELRGTYTFNELQGIEKVITETEKDKEVWEKIP